MNQKIMSSPIPIPYSKNGYSYMNRKAKHITNSLANNYNNNSSMHTTSHDDCCKSKKHAVSAPVPIIDCGMCDDDNIDFTDFTDMTHFNDVLPLHNKQHHIHLVNGMNVDPTIQNSDKFFVFCDCPSIKDFSKKLTFTILESKIGIIAFTNKEHMLSLKNCLNIPQYVVEISRNDLKQYSKDNKTTTTILYNSYSDIETHSSYFLYFNL